MQDRPSHPSDGLHSIREPLQAVVQRIDQRYELQKADIGSSQSSPVTTGIKALDELSPCLWEGEITLLTGPPGIGKTSLICQFATHAAIDLKRAVAFYTLGESRLRAVRYMLSAQGSLAYDQLLSGRMDEDDWDWLTVAIGELHDAPIFLNDACVNVETLCKEVREQWQSLGELHPRMLFIDNFESIVTGAQGADRCAFIANAMRVLRELAVELAMPILLASLWGALSRTECSNYETYCAIEQQIILIRSHSKIEMLVGTDTDDFREVTAVLCGKTEKQKAKFRLASVTQRHFG